MVKISNWAWVAAGVLAGVVIAGMTLAPSLAAINDGLTCLVTNCADLAAQRSMAVAAWAMVAITGLGTIVGGVSLALIFWTLDAARRSAKAAELASEHALASLQLSEKSAQDARRFGAAQTRSYLTVSSVTIACDERLEIKVGLVNSGSTPARSVHVSVDVRVEIATVEGGAPIVLDMPAGSAGSEYHLADLGSGDKEPIQLSVVGLLEAIDDSDLAEGRVTVVVKGTLAYQDVFGTLHPYSFGFMGKPDADEPSKGVKLPRIATVPVDGLSWI